MRSFASLVVLGLSLSACASEGESNTSESETGTSETETETETESETGDDDQPPSADGWLHSDRTFIRDSLDRVVVLRGVNARVEGVFDVTFDDGRLLLEEVPEFTAADAERIRSLGFNVVRLPINWSGIEPEQGAYSEAYLAKVDAVVEACAAVGIWVMLDYHQDAYSKEIGEDGAPLWAIQPPPTELLGGPLGDSLAMRRSSPQVLAAFNGFFNDEDEADDDVWLQAAFADMAAHVAARYADEPAVMGYELYNEPLAGFETFIWRFHERVVPSIRAVDERHLILFEPNVIRNGTEAAPLSPTPFVDDQGVYAPHLYTFSFSSNPNPLENLTLDDLRPNMEAARAEAESWATPLFVGEWGISPTVPNADRYVELMYTLLDEGLHHSAMWLWKEQSQGRWGFYDHAEGPDGEDLWTERPEIIAVHARPYAPAIAGEPISAHYDLATERFTLRLDGREDAVPTRLHVPAAPYYPAQFEVRCDEVTVAGPADRDPLSGEIDVVCSGAGERTITLQPVSGG